MADVLEFPLDDGALVRIELPPGTHGGRRAEVARESKVIKRLQETLLQALKPLSHVADAILQQMKECKQTPTEVHVEFEFTFSAEGSLYIASLKSGANFKVRVAWAADR